MDSHSLYNQASSLLTARSPLSVPDSSQQSLTSNSTPRTIDYCAVDRKSSRSFESAISPRSSIAVDSGWWTPQHSPETHHRYDESESNPLSSDWTLPTPPRSEPSVRSDSVDASESFLSASVCAGSEFGFNQPTISAEMSSLGLLLPSQYGTSIYDAEHNQYSMDPNYAPPPMRMAHSSSGGGMPVYASSAASSHPGLYPTRGMMNQTMDTTDLRRPHDIPFGTTDFPYRRSSNTYESSSAHVYPPPSGPTIPSIRGIPHNPATSPQPSSHYATAITRSPGGYDPSVFQPTPFPPQLHHSHQYPGPGHPSPAQPPMSYPHYGSAGSSESASKSPTGNHEPRMPVLNQRPKPQCWDHGCNGRQFSTFSNLLRHQREKSGTAAKSYCPKCNAEFTRTTARNGHLAHDKCTRQRRSSDGGKS